MHPKDIALFKLIIEFSDVIEVTPPRTTDIGQWWDNALSEISDYWLNDLVEHGIFTDNKGKITQKMRQRLLEEFKSRQLLCALA